MKFQGSLRLLHTFIGLVLVALFFIPLCRGDEILRKNGFDDYETIEEAFNSKDTESVVWAAEKVCNLGPKAAPFVDNILSALNFFHANNDTEVVFKLVMALAAIGPAAKKSVSQLESLLSEEKLQRQVIIALVKIASCTIELPDCPDPLREPVFSFLGNKSSECAFYFQRVPDTALKRNCTSFSSYILRDLPLRIELKDPLHLGNNFSLNFWWKASNLSSNTALNLLSSDLVQFKLSKSEYAHKTNLDIAFRLPSAKKDNAEIENGERDLFKPNIATMGSFGNSSSLSEDQWNNIIMIRNGSQHSIKIYLNGDKVATCDDFTVWSDRDRSLITCFPKTVLKSMVFGGKPYDDHLKFDSNGQIELSSIEFYNCSLSEAAAKEKFAMQKMTYFSGK